MATPRLLVKAAELTRSGALQSGPLLILQEIVNQQRGFAMIPSDTCYSLAARPTGLKMSRRINLVLDRKEEPISLAFDGVRRVQQWVQLDVAGARLLANLTPGPLTLVCRLLEGVHTEIADDVLAVPDRTLGVRIPDSRIETQLVEACNSPLTTVAVRDRTTKQPVTDFEQARALVEEGIARLDHPPPIGLVEARQPFAVTHSTVIRVPPQQGRFYDVLRAGAITEDQLDEALRSISPSELGSSN
ncbi:MAG TPA: Sua5/YciO/YrdC/YwlC family protein [Thermoanaerobaculia bacterium]|nr:Sua5/YciO/YrdC/YwlC family protein [Thermoanaerobaculia bacterium]